MAKNRNKFIFSILRQQLIDAKLQAYEHDKNDTNKLDTDTARLIKKEMLNHVTKSRLCVKIIVCFVVSLQFCRNESQISSQQRHIRSMIQKWKIWLDEDVSNCFQNASQRSKSVCNQQARRNLDEKQSPEKTLFSKSNHVISSRIGYLQNPELYNQ